MTKFTYCNKKRVGFLVSDHFDLIREHFSYENTGAVFARKRGAWYAKSRKYVITPGGKFDVGLTFEIAKFVRKELPGEEITYDDLILSQLKPQISNTDLELSLPLRDYQKEIVDTCFKFGRGTVVLATAGGKTLVMANLLERLYKATKDKPTWKVLLMVPDLGLVNQTYNDFKKYGCSFQYGKWTGNSPVNLGDNVIIANLGILQSGCSDIEWIKYIDVLIVDEVHKVRCKNKVNKILKTIETPIKFGFTGTLPDTNEDIWNIYGKIGPKIYEKGSYELRQENYVSNLLIHVLKLEYRQKPFYPDEINDPGERYRLEFDFLFTNTFRNNILKKITTEVNNNVLLLVDYIRHGEELYNVLKDNDQGKQVFFIQGDVDVEERENVKQLIETNDNIICIAISKIFSTGISINNLHYIIFGSGGKAKIKILQSIGRGLRLHKNKEKLVIFDIADQLRYGKSHADGRAKLYEKEKIPVKYSTITQK